MNSNSNGYRSEVRALRGFVMGRLVELRTFRLRMRRQFLDVHGAELEAFICRFLAERMTIDFEQLARVYLDQCAADAQSLWDYDELREKLTEGLDAVIGEEIMQALRRTRWFRPSLFTSEEILERCVSAYILGMESYSAASDGVSEV